MVGGLIDQIIEIFIKSFEEFLLFFTLADELIIHVFDFAAKFFELDF